jgi:hypothetical protein
MARSALHGLATTFLALGRQEDAKAFLALMLSTSEWSCECCEEGAVSENAAGMCEYSLDFFCGPCFKKLKHPRYTRFCVKGHSLVEVTASMEKIPEGSIRFRGVCQDGGVLGYIEI